MNRTTLVARMQRYGIEGNHRPIKPTKDKGFKPTKDKGFKPRKYHTEFSALKEKAVLESLERNSWNRSHAAVDLGISLRGIRLIIADLKLRGVDVPDSSWKRPRRTQEEMAGHYGFPAR
jgi:hypothetical protein